MRYVLASASPRRKELFAKIKADFEIITSDVDEKSDESEPGERVMQLAAVKAQNVYDKIGRCDDCVVIGADTLCYMDGVYLGKPRDARHAAQMLRSMSGRTHYVYTGVAIVYGDTMERFFARSEVTFKQLDEEAIADYVSTGRPLDKAGAYGIQDGCVVAAWSGSYDNIVGLPTEQLAEKLRELGL